MILSPLLRGCLITACSLALLPTLSVGGETSTPAGAVLAIKGVVTVSGRVGQAPRTLQHGDNLFSGDNIQAQDGQAQVRFSDGGLLSVYPNSAANIDDYLFLNQDPAHSKCLLSLTKGTFAARTGEIGKQAGEQFQMKTDFATLFVRGTEFTVKVADTMSVAVNEGAVVMNNGAGSHEVKQGNTATFTSFSRAPEMSSQTVGLRSGGQQNKGNASGEGGQKKGEGGGEGEGGRQASPQGSGREGGGMSGTGGAQGGGGQMGGAGPTGAGPAAMGMPTGLPLGGGFSMGRSGGGSGTTGPIGGNPPPMPGAAQMQNQVGNKIIPAMQPQQPPPQQPPPQQPPPQPAMRH
ncbi:MAG: FecR domain-containing protein [Magnetococcales bacterium]|nr:FecR domain-containing protein [Magnetococcales bacterium]MBF0116228.1 FecR domain-containing protein [Magnetococcales bacterium]